MRGLRVFTRRTEHNDIRVGNTLEVYVEENGRKFLRHYLIDFGSAFGNDTIQPNAPEVGHEYRLDFQQAAQVALTAGINQPRWRDEKSDPVFSPSVGSFSAKNFEPTKWKQNFPLAAFTEMTDADAFRAARVIAQFSPAQIRTAVESAEFSSAGDTDYVTLQLIRRQHKIIAAYANRRAGFGDFTLSKNDDDYVLNFADYRNFSRITDEESKHGYF